MCISLLLLLYIIRWSWNANCIYFINFKNHNNTLPSSTKYMRITPHKYEKKSSKPSVYQRGGLRRRQSFGDSLNQSAASVGRSTQQLPTYRSDSLQRAASGSQYLFQSYNLMSVGGQQYYDDSCGRSERSGLWAILIFQYMHLMHLWLTCQTGDPSSIFSRCTKLAINHFIFMINCNHINRFLWYIRRNKMLSFLYKRIYIAARIFLIVQTTHTLGNKTCTISLIDSSVHSSIDIEPCHPNQRLWVGELLLHTWCLGCQQKFLFKCEYPDWNV